MKAFTKLKIRDLILKNRFGIPPMCSFVANAKGEVNQFHLSRYNAFSMGGFGFIIIEATAVEPIGRISAADLGIWDDYHIKGLSELVSSIKMCNKDVHVAIQLAHAGRKGSSDLPWKGFKHLSVEEGGYPIVSCSPIPFDKDHSVPKELSVKEILEVEQKFVDAAKRAVQCKFDAIEIHGAHGYLINQFLSPLTNYRKDEYGGSFENRIRFLVEIVEKVRAVIPTGMPLLVRLSVSEWARDKNGWDIADSIKLAKILKEKGVDMIDCSGGNNTSDCIPLSGPCYQVHYAEELKKNCGIMTAAVGEITTIEQVKDILDNDKADLVLIGRGALKNPYFPHICAEQLGFNAEERANMYPLPHGHYLKRLWLKQEREKQKKEQSK